MTITTNFISEYLKLENEWDTILVNAYGNKADVLSWQALQRVVRTNKKIIKLQNNNLNTKVPNGHELSNEYRALSIASKLSFDFQPKLKDLENGWVALELKIFDGFLLSEANIAKSKKIRAIFNLFHLLFKLSARGVLHKQIRPRHIMVNANGDICLIDYGGAQITTPVVAMLANFGLIPYRLPQMLYLLKAFTRGSLPKPSPSIKFASNEFLNSVKKLSETSDYKEQPGYMSLIQVLDDLRRLSKISSRHVFSVPSFRLGNLEVPGNWDFEPVRRAVQKGIKFGGKKVLLIGSASWLMGVFASTLGAQVLVVENDDATVDVLRQLFDNLIPGINVELESILYASKQSFDCAISFDLAGTRDLATDVNNLSELASESYLVSGSNNLSEALCFDSKFRIRRLLSGRANVFKVI